MDNFRGLRTATLTTLAGLDVPAGTVYWVTSEGAAYEAVPLSETHDITGIIGWNAIRGTVAMDAPMQQYVEWIGEIDTDGDDRPASAQTAIVVPYGLPTYFRIRVPQMYSGASLYDASGIPYMGVSVGGTPVGSIIQGTVSSPGVFDFDIGQVHQGLVGADVTATVAVSVRTTLKNRLVIAPTRVKFKNCGFPVNVPPTLTINTVPETMSIGLLSLSGIASDFESQLTSSSLACTVTVGATPHVVPVTLTNGVWTASLVITDVAEIAISVTATDSYGGTTTVTAATETLTSEQSWDGTWEFSTGYATMTSPSSGAQVLALSATGATSGNQLRVTFPAGVSDANITVPSGYRMSWLTRIVPALGSELNGLIPWSYGGTWEVLLQIDTVALEIIASAAWTYVAPADMVWFERSAVDVAGNGTVIDSWPESVDPMAAYGVTRGMVRHGGTGAFVIDISATTAGVSVLGWMKTQDTSGAPSVAAFGSSYEPGNTDPELGLGDFEISSSGDVVETWGGLPLQSIYLNAANSASWPGAWENNDTADRMSFSGIEPGSGQTRFPSLRNRWVSLCVTYSGNNYARYCNSMTACTQALGGTTATGPDGIVIGAERNGISVGRNAEAYYGDLAVVPRAVSVEEATAFYRETQATLASTANSSISCFVLGSSFMTLESGQAHRMSYYLQEQGTALGVTIQILDDFADGAQGVSTPSGNDTNLQAQVNRLLLAHTMHRSAIVFVDWMSMVNEQVLYATNRGNAIGMIVEQLNRLRRAGVTIVMPEVSSCRLGGVIYGPEARSDQLTDWISQHADTCIIWINTALQADPATNFFDQGTPGLPETYGPHLAEPAGAGITGKRLVARAAVEAMIDLHHNRLARYTRPA